ncbi:MAG: dihydrolipoamide acetyltransferase family protein [Moritella sp.]|uniref:dihydrolipoamide acetyltransferase family protein n=1 Tax=Moritella sp. TaxID=78556 RepID=UPI0029A5F9C4|nr:dihydrolipoamide acetyltransferase family protein [Moritella sp.]MDX2320897.1 dihydrolipoamide acetyltransferase family protein [Moritella sp.]
MSSNEHELKMPSFGSDMRKGSLTNWLVKEGDHIKRGDVIAVIETSKGAIELDIFEDSQVVKLLVKEGDKVAVGEPIARLSSATANDSKPATTDKENTLETPAKVLDSTTTKTLTSTETLTDTEKTTNQQTANSHLPVHKNFVLATPAARQLACQQQLSLAKIFANNNNKIVTRAMVEQASQNQQSNTPLAMTETALQKNTSIEQNSDLDSPQHQQTPIKKGFDKDTMRQAISDTVTRSKREIPHYYLKQRIDITALQNHLQGYNNNVPVSQRLLLAAPLLCAIARLLITNKQLNGEYLDGKFLPSETVNLGNAINLRGGGLVMPVIHDAQNLSVELMMEELKQQVSRSRNGSLAASQLSGGSCTVTSIGERGAEQMFAVIYPPQVAIIALGSPHQEVLAIDGAVHIRSVIDASLAADHRVSDGHIGARFLYQLNQLLQDPEILWQTPS